MRAGIATGPIEDLYIVPTDFLNARGEAVLAGGGPVTQAVFRVSINPLAWWLWMAGPIFILGSVIALWPQPTVELSPALNRRRRPTRSAALQTGD